MHAKQNPHTSISRAIPSAFDLSALQAQLLPVTRQTPLQVSNRGWAETFRPERQSTKLQSSSQGIQSSWREEYRQYIDNVSTKPFPSPHNPQSQSLYADTSSKWQKAMAAKPMYYSPPVRQYQPMSYYPNQSLSSLAQQPHPSPGLVQDRGVPTDPPVQAETLNESQEVLAQAAQSLVDELDDTQSILAANPKLAGSQFMALMRGLGDREVVVKDEVVGSVIGDQVSEGAKFVHRSNAGVDWAGDFLGHRAKNQTPEGDRVNDPISLRMGPVQSQYTMFDPQTQSHHWNLMAWDQQFQDQSAISMNEQSSAYDAQQQRRKSVHFETPLGHGVPKSLDEALASTTAVPGATSAWAEDSLDDFGEDAFMAYNGEMRQSLSPRIGLGAMEGWGNLQNDWESFQRAESSKAGFRGMGRGDQTERYLFQSGNPYSAGVVDAEEFGRESPTFKV